MKLSKNFSLDELTHSDFAVKHEIENIPDARQVENLKFLCDNILQPVRDYFNVPIFINSGFRGKQLNSFISSVSTSHHCANGGFAAADFYVINAKMKDVFIYIQNNLEFSQLIWERGNNIAPDWIHCSTNSLGSNIKDILKFDGKIYKKFRL